MNTREAVRGVGKLIMIDGSGWSAPAGDEVRRLVGRPERTYGCSPTLQPGACWPDAPRCPDDGPGRDAVRVAGERALWAGLGPAEVWR